MFYIINHLDVGIYLKNVFVLFIDCTNTLPMRILIYITYMQNDKIIEARNHKVAPKKTICMGFH